MNLNELNLRQLAIYFGIAFIITLFAMTLITGVFQNQILPVLQGKRPKIYRVPKNVVVLLNKIDSLENTIDELLKKETPEKELYIAQEELKALRRRIEILQKKNDSLIDVNKEFTSVKIEYVHQIDSLSKELDSLRKIAGEVDSLRQEYNKLFSSDVLEEIREREKTIRNLLEKGEMKVAKMIAGMRADQAAQVLSGMPDDAVLAILFKMREREAARILNEMEPARASSLFVRLERLGR